MVTSNPLELVFIGGGPTAASLLERLSASAMEFLGERPLHVHLVDPHRPGTGRVWRPDLSPLLWMNSLAEDVTMFTDSSVRCAGPIRPGPSLLGWATMVDDAALALIAPPDLVTEVRAVGGTTFPSRRVQAAYLEWFHRLVVAELPATVTVSTHQRRVLDVIDMADAEGHGGRQRIVFDDGSTMEADVVVLNLGHLDAEPAPQGAAYRSFAARRGLVYLPAGHTGDLDLSVLKAGHDVIVSGFGQAFTDLMILLSAGRGGRFLSRDDGSLRYEPSGDEPVLHVGSRRGVPYRSKLDYRLGAPLAPLPHFLAETAVSELLARPERLDFWRDVFPLVAKEVCWAYYHELFVAHPHRTTTTWDAFAARYEPLTWGDEVDRLVAETVPALADRFDFVALDRPLAGVRDVSAAAVQARIAAHIAADVARRTNPAQSADLGAFMGLLSSFAILARIAASGRMTDRSRVEDISGSWFSFFMYYASGPPPARLRQYLALAEAGLLRFVGADLTVAADEQLGRFVARSSSHDEEVVATALVDARIASASVSRSAEPLLRALYERGEVVEEVVDDAQGWRTNTGKLLVAGAEMRVVGADGTAHPRRYALGAFTSRPASGVLSRPRANAPTFRQNDVVARSVLKELAAIGLANHAGTGTGRAQAEVVP